MPERRNAPCGAALRAMHKGRQTGLRFVGLVHRSAAPPHILFDVVAHYSSGFNPFVTALIPRALGFSNVPSYLASDGRCLRSSHNSAILAKPCRQTLLPTRGR